MVESVEVIVVRILTDLLRREQSRPNNEGQINTYGQSSLDSTEETVGQQMGDRD